MVRLARVPDHHTSSASPATAAPTRVGRGGGSGGGGIGEGGRSSASATSLANLHLTPAVPSAAARTLDIVRRGSPGGDQDRGASPHAEEDCGDGPGGPDGGD